jgi:hypothetical protein
MDLATFRRSLAEAAPPEGLPPALAGLWWDAKGDWDRAHECAQQRDDPAGVAVHAYLHRKEGDLANAAYWYRRASRDLAVGPIEEEWDALAEALLGS